MLSRFLNVLVVMLFFAQVCIVNLWSQNIVDDYLIAIVSENQIQRFGKLSDLDKTELEFTSSNLPLIIINTEGVEIVDEPKITGRMGIINNHEGERNHLTDEYNNYNGFIGIELRGQSSKIYDKKSYGIETRDKAGNDLNVSLLGMPEENDWVLYGPYSDKTLIRNTLSFYLARQMDQYASRTEFCEVFINGEYKGLYVLMEKIKRDSNRVNIAKLNPEDISGEDG